MAAFIPIPYTYASFLTPSGKYIDVKVLAVKKRSKRALIDHPLLGQIEVYCKELEEPLNPDVNTRFRYFDKMLDLALHRKLPCLCVVGKGGIGKSFQTKLRINANSLDEGDYRFVKGYSTARALYNTLHEYKDKVLILDDCDSVLKDANARNILKSVLDSNTCREVSWLSQSKGDSVPSTFEFTGTVIFLSNWGKDEFDQTILSRATMIDLHLTVDELIDRMAKIIDYLDVGKTLSTKQKRVLLHLMRKYKHTVYDLNLRTLRKAVTIYEESGGNLELTRYQIIQG